MDEQDYKPAFDSHFMFLSKFINTVQGEGDSTKVKSIASSKPVSRGERESDTRFFALRFFRDSFPPSFFSFFKFSPAKEMLFFAERNAGF